MNSSFPVSLAGAAVPLLSLSCMLLLLAGCGGQESSGEKAEE